MPPILMVDLMTAPTPLLSVKNLKTYFPLDDGVVKAVDGVSFDIYSGRTLGIVGESGCGKTTVGRTILRLYEPTGGEIRYKRMSGEWIDIAHISLRDMKPLRREMRMIFQDPFSALDPRMIVADIVAEPLRLMGHTGARERREPDHRRTGDGKGDQQRRQPGAHRVVRKTTARTATPEASART